MGKTPWSKIIVGSILSAVLTCAPLIYYAGATIQSLKDGQENVKHELEQRFTDIRDEQIRQCDGNETRFARIEDKLDRTAAAQNRYMGTKIRMYDNGR